jgi:membrane-associated protein
MTRTAWSVRRPAGGTRSDSYVAVGEQGDNKEMTPMVPQEYEVPRSDPGRRRAQIACVTGIAVNTVFALVLLFLTPSLIGTNPVLLEALRGSTPALASGGAFARVGEASLVLAILAPLPTLLFVTPFYWWAGQLWGPKAASVLSGGHPSAEKWAKRSGAHLERLGGLAVTLAPILPIPSAFIYAAAGWTGMRLRRFMIFDVLGMLIWICLVVGLGYAIGHPAVHIAKEISHYGLEVTLALVVIAVFITTMRTRRAERAGT